MKVNSSHNNPSIIKKKGRGRKNEHRKGRKPILVRFPERNASVLKERLWRREKKRKAKSSSEGQGKMSAGEKKEKVQGITDLTRSKNEKA